MNPNDTEHQTMNAGADSAQESVNGAASEAASEADPVAVLEAEKADLKDKLLRLMADMENLRRRTEREVADARTYAVANFARDMLNVATTSAAPSRACRRMPAAPPRALQGPDRRHRPHRARPAQDPRAPWSQEARPAGQKFDPNVHQAMFEIPNAEVPNGTVLQVVQSGYVIGERVLRPHGRRFQGRPEGRQRRRLRGCGQFIGCFLRTNLRLNWVQHENGAFPPSLWGRAGRGVLRFLSSSPR
jgi:molecular chaperone GrpE